MLAKDIMTRDVAFVTADTHICDVARLLIERGISGVPVVDADHRPVGMISEGDLIRTDEFRGFVARRCVVARRQPSYSIMRRG